MSASASESDTSQSGQRPTNPSATTANTQASHSARGDRPINPRQTSSKSVVSQSSADPTDSSSTAANTSLTVTPRTPFTPSTTSTSIPTQTSHFRIPASPRSAIMAPAPGDASKAAKVAIPRLKRSLEAGEATTKPGGRHRVTHACEPCRHRKTKCSGERPTCRHCQDFKIQCYYADGKRDRVKKQFGSMAEKVADYERLLRDLQARVSEDDMNLIKGTLDRAALLDNDDVQAETATISAGDMYADSEPSGAESDASGGAGSTGALDRTDEDFTREGAKANGFMGKNSDITWMQRLRHENKHGDSQEYNTDDPDSRRRATGPSLPPHNRSEANVPFQEAESGFTVQDTSYHLDDLSITPFEAIDPFELPTHDHAHKLFTTYMNRVHPSFPLIGRTNLQNQFAKFLARPMNRPPQKWLAIINLIFAIAAKYSHLIQAEWRADERDHLVFFARARLLAIDSETLFNHPDLQSIQIFGLIAYYLTSVEQINRAWLVVGMAVRGATCLGLNMRNESTELSDSLKEIRYRVWWALYSLEHRLCTMTGRLTSIPDDQCTTPLPVPILEDDFETEAGRNLLSPEKQRGVRAPSSNSQTPPNAESIASSRSASKDDKAASRSPSVSQVQYNELEWAKEISPNSSLYFLYLVHLCRITQDIFHKLYNPSALNGKWSDLQVAMRNLNNRIEGWYRNLPPAFDFGRKQRDRDLYEARLSLGFYYYATKQMVYRPCLCRLDRKLPGQSAKSNEFNHSAAIACVNAAREQLQLIPDEPNAVGLLRVGPWMSLLHLLVQSTTVLMLELSFRGHHMPERAGDILEDAKKAVRWLHALGEENLAAARAWKTCHGLLVDSARKIGRSVDDMPRERPRSLRSSSTELDPSAPQSVYDPGVLQPQDPQHQAFSQQQSMPPMTTMEMQGYHNYTAFDQMMQYENLFNMSGDNIGHAHMNPASGGMDYTADMNLNYMNSYTGPSMDQSDTSGGNMSAHNMSGFR